MPNIVTYVLCLLREQVISVLMDVNSSRFPRHQISHKALVLQTPLRKPPRVGRAIAQAASRWLPIAAARVRDRVWSSGICGQSGAGAGFLRVLRFPLPIFIPPNSPSS
jgi:hypothetical protein